MAVSSEDQSWQFEVLMAIALKITVIWNVTPFSLVYKTIILPVVMYGCEN
jgi:hypothetical protein